MKKLNLETEIGMGKNIEINVLFEGSKRKIVQITLRENAILKAHKAAEPITIQCVVGSGELLDITNNAKTDLSPGVLITVEPEVLHEVKALPEVSILLTKFL